MIRNRATKLRLMGKSYNEIHAELGVPKSTLAGWLNKLTLPHSAQKRLLNRVAQGTLNGLVKRNKLQTIKAIERTGKIREGAKNEIHGLSERELTLIGTALYWAEGYKRAKRLNGRVLISHSISLTNSDPEMIRFFVNFFQRHMGIKKEAISVNLRLFKHIDSDKAIKYWVKVTKLKKSNFRTPTCVISKSSQGKRPFERLPYGVAQVRVNDTDKFYRLMGWIDGLKTQLVLGEKKV